MVAAGEYPPAGLRQHDSRCDSRCDFDASGTRPTSETRAAGEKVSCWPTTALRTAQRFNLIIIINLRVRQPASPSTLREQDGRRWREPPRWPSSATMAFQRDSRCDFTAAGTDPARHPPLEREKTSPAGREQRRSAALQRKKTLQDNIDKARRPKRSGGPALPGSRPAAGFKPPRESEYRGTLLIKESPPPMGTPQGPRQIPTVGS